jgi:hypothetical protein
MIRLGLLPKVPVPLTETAGRKGSVCCTAERGDYQTRTPGDPLPIELATTFGIGENPRPPAV